jgi:hypothetical protein
MDITFGKKSVKDAKFLDDMMEIQEEIVIWKIKKKNSHREELKKLYDIEIELN